MQKEAQGQGQERPSLQTLDFNEIHEEGAYVMFQSGSLIRVLPDAVAPGHSPLVSIKAKDRSWTRVAKLSNDPTTPISTLRTLAADSDILPQF